MIELSNYKGLSVAVMGLSRTGISAIESLRAGGAARIYVWDDKKTAADVEIEGIIFAHPAHYPWHEISGMIVSPGIPPSNNIIKMAVAKGCPLLCDIQLLCESQKHAKFIGITGSNGKSTVTALLHEMLVSSGLRSQCGGNIGIPALSLESDSDYYILELSSFQLELCNRLPLDLAIFINLESDHLDRYASIDDYIAAKCRIFDHPKITGLINIDNSYCREIYNQLSNNKIPVSTSKLYEEGFALINDNFYKGLTKQGAVIKSRSLVNESIAFALAAGMQLGIPYKNLSETLSRFGGLPHRCQQVRTMRNIVFIDDSKATNLHSMSHTLKSYKNIYLLAGGILKDTSVHLLEYGNLKHIYLFGKAKLELEQIFRDRAPVTICNDLESATHLAFKEAYESADQSTEQNIILSPGCSSFDQFDNFEHRGREFDRIVQAL